MKYFFYHLSVAFLLISCKNSPQKLPSLTTGQLFEKFRKNIVLIKSKSYYKITFEDKSVAFFNNIYENYISDFTFSEAEARDNASVEYGTGFFVGKNGLIATNFHVACGGMHDLLSTMNFNTCVYKKLSGELKQADYAVTYYAEKLKQHHPDDSSYFSKLLLSNIDKDSSNTAKNEDDDNDDDDYFPEVRDTSITNFHKVIDSSIAVNEKIQSIVGKTFKIEIVPVELSIMMDGSTGDANEYPCHLYSLTDDKAVDLAIIQTDLEEEPIGINKSIDAFSDKSSVGNIISEKDTIKVTSSLFLIGYNYGPEIAQTSKGIKVQLTKGEVSQDNDDYRVLYSIPSLPGSSGSPVFNNKGQLVAINYCGYTTKDNFNYGVLAWQLQKILNKKPSLKMPD
jgi:S1-C subfamily serine protease